jgi:glutamine amidotransferase
MCRFITYSGLPLALVDLLYRPSNSLIMQSHHARERPEPLNGDGFGVGWYAPEVDETPCIQRYTTPAWSNRNLHSLAPKVNTKQLFAHVRAASPGMAVSELNVHPFSCGSLMWMHNGMVAGFKEIKRKLRAGLSDDAYALIQGTTDSEHAFAMFVNNLREPAAIVSAAEMRRALVATIGQLNELTSESGIADPSFYNFAVTNGRDTVVSRYCSKTDLPAASLHYSRGSRFECRPDGVCDMVDHSVEGRAEAVIVSSERLTDDQADWPNVPDNHTITVLADLNVRLEPIEV